MTAGGRAAHRLTVVLGTALALAAVILIYLIVLTRGAIL